MNETFSLELLILHSFSAKSIFKDLVPAANGVCLMKYDTFKAKSFLMSTHFKFH